MIEVFKLNIELIRKRFSIYGLFNIISLCFVLLGLLFGIKFLEHKFGYYKEITLFLINFIYVACGKHVIPSNFDRNVQRHRTYFTLLNVKDIENYYMYKNLITFYVAVTYVIFPTSIQDLGIFTFYLAVMNILIFIIILFKNKLNKNKYLSLVNCMNIGCLIFTILYMKNFITIPFEKILNQYSIIIFIVISIYLTFKNFKHINPNDIKGNSVYFMGLSKKMLFLFNDKDLLFIIRKNLLLDPILVILLTNVSVKNTFNSSSDLLLSCILSFTCSFIMIYMNLLKNDESKVIFFYGPKDFKKFRIEKIKNTICISLIIFLIVLLPLIILIPIKIILPSYIISISLFLISTIIIKINLEKTLNFKKTISNKEILIILLLAILGSITVSSIISNFII